MLSRRSRTSLSPHTTSRWNRGIRNAVFSIWRRTTFGYCARGSGLSIHAFFLGEHHVFQITTTRDDKMTTVTQVGREKICSTQLPGDLPFLTKLDFSRSVFLIQDVCQLTQEVLHLSQDLDLKSYCPNIGFI